MSLSLALLAPLLAQVGPLVTPGAAPPLPHQTRIEERRPPRRTQAQPAAPAVVAPAPSRKQLCLQLAEEAPASAEASAESWLGQAQGADKAAAAECLGAALSAQQKWGAAEAAFLAAREATADKPTRARFGAQAGNAALARGDAAAALEALDAAQADAAGDAALASTIAVDRARALVSLKRNQAAEAALAEARTAAPDNAQAWLLSATLSRRLDKLAAAQEQIEKAAELQPADPEIGLEAGLIAVLGGRDEAARKSWQSVLATAPGSEAAATAKTYLAQLGPSPETPSR